MKYLSTYLFFLLFLVSLVATAQRDNVIYPQNYDTKFQDVYVDANDLGYAVGTCGIISRTTDGGMSWTLVDEVDSAFDYYAVTCPDDDCRKAVIGGDGIVLRRLSSGSFRMTTGDEFQSIRRLFDLDDNVIVATKEINEIIRSTDNGASWTTINPAEVINSAPVFADGKVGYMVSGEDKMLKTTDGGLTWSETGYTVPNDVRSIYFRDADNGWYQQGASKSVFRTTNGGVSWTDLNVTNGPRAILWMESFSATHLVCAGLVNEAWQSMDGGATWARDFFPQEPGTRPNFYNYHRRGDEFFVPSDGAEIFYSAANFTNWTGSIPADRGSLSTVEFFNDNIGLVAGNTSFLIKTTNGGDSWTSLDSDSPNQNAPVYDIDMRSATEYVLYYGNQYPRITKDGGSSFTEYIGSGSGLAVNDLQQFYNRSDGKLLVMGQTKAGISSDDGVSWTVYPHDLATQIFDMHFVNDNVGFVVGNRMLAKTIDGGQTWTNLTDNIGASRYNAVFFYDENRGIVSGSRPKVTFDGGITWANSQTQGAAAHYEMDTDGNLWGASFQSGNNGALALNKDDDNGWVQVAFSCAAYSSLDLTPSGRFIFTVGNGGHISRFSTDAIVSSRNPQRPVANLKAFPNPTSGDLSVDLVASNRPTTLSIYAASGQLVREFTVPAGTERFRMDLSGQKPGVYVLRWMGNGSPGYTGRVVLR